MQNSPANQDKIKDKYFNNQVIVNGKKYRASQEFFIKSEGCCLRVEEKYQEYDLMPGYNQYLRDKKIKQNLQIKREIKIWTEQEDKLLQQLVSESNSNWAWISQNFDNRTPVQCSQRWRRIHPEKKRIMWTQEEDVKLYSIVDNLKKQNKPINWQDISKQMPCRTGQQIRQRYVNNLDPSINHNPWTKQEDMQIINFFQQLGGKWSEISRQMNGGRPENAIKNRFNSYIKKVYDPQNNFEIRPYYQQLLGIADEQQQLNKNQLKMECTQHKNEENIRNEEEENINYQINKSSNPKSQSTENTIQQIRNLPFLQNNVLSVEVSNDSDQDTEMNKEEDIDINIAESISNPNIFQFSQFPFNQLSEDNLQQPIDIPQFQQKLQLSLQQQQLNQHSTQLNGNNSQYYDPMHQQKSQQNFIQLENSQINFGLGFSSINQIPQGQPINNEIYQPIKENLLQQQNCNFGYQNDDPFRNAKNIISPSENQQNYQFYTPFSQCYNSKYYQTQYQSLKQPCQFQQNIIYQQQNLNYA